MSNIILENYNTTQQKLEVDFVLFRLFASYFMQGQNKVMVEFFFFHQKNEHSEIQN